MIGLISEHSDTFLRIVAAVIAIGFAVPISLAPLSWARALRWTVDSQSDLALYFGRCLGVVAFVLSWAGWHAAGQPALQPFFFQVLISISTFMVVVHVVGAIQRVQPWTENVEIGFWAALVVSGLLFYPIHVGQG